MLECDSAAGCTYLGLSCSLIPLQIAIASELLCLYLLHGSEMVVPSDNSDF